MLMYFDVFEVYSDVFSHDLAEYTQNTHRIHYIHVFHSRPPIHPPPCYHAFRILFKYIKIQCILTDGTDPSRYVCLCTEYTYPASLEGIRSTRAARGLLPRRAASPCDPPVGSAPGGHPACILNLGFARDPSTSAYPRASTPAPGVAARDLPFADVCRAL